MSMPGRSQRPHIPPAYRAQPELHAPTLLQFWRSDVRTAPGRRRPTWAGLIAFWLGLLAAAMLLVDVVALAGPGALAEAAAPLSVVAFLAGLVAVVAGVGRALGVFGLVFAVLGNVEAWRVLGSLFA